MPVEPLRVLVVEDDADAREAIADALRLIGHQVSTVHNGAEALAYVRAAEPPCLIVLDLMMPKVDGWQVLAALHKDQRERDFPVVVVSAFDARGLPPGVPFLRKPFMLDALITMVQLQWEQRTAI